MFNLENVFGKKAKKAMMTKEEIAEFIPSASSQFCGINMEGGAL